MESGGYEVTYVPNHHAQDGLPFTGQEYAAYDAVILSDIGSNTLLLPSATFGRSEKRPNRCQAIRDYVLDGGALVMIGGYMSFTGIDAKARYGSTALADVLPVVCLEMDDRREHSEGVYGVVTKDHPLTQGIVGDWPALLGYNRTLRREVPGALERRTRRRAQLSPHLLGDDARQRRLAQPQKPIKEDSQIGRASCRERV